MEAMEALKEWLIPYIISNIVFALCIVAALKRPMWAMIFFSGIFPLGRIFQFHHCSSVTGDLP
jgi:hypothetical protein